GRCRSEKCWIRRGARLKLAAVDPQPLQEKVVVIVGGTTGLGVSADNACVDAGARVVSVGRNPDNAQAAARALGADALATTGDAADPRTAPAAIETAIK